MDDLLESVNKHDFKFDRDFVLKTCLVLLGHGARYEVKKFRKEGVREEIVNKWEEIAKAIQSVLDFVRGRTFIRSGKALPAYLVLIPLVYLRYHFPESWKKAKDVETYLLRCSLAGAFSGQSDRLLDALVKKLAELKEFSADEAFRVIASQNRSLQLTEERLWQMGYGSDTIHLLFNLWYSFDYTPSYVNNLPEVDHIFPQSLLPKRKYGDADRNQLANCMLLTKEEDGPGGKGSKPPEEWFAEALADKHKGPDYLKKHLIPNDPAIWKLERFEDFIEERKKLIREKFKFLLGPVAKQKDTVENK